MRKINMRNEIKNLRNEIKNLRNRFQNLRNRFAKSEKSFSKCEKSKLRKENVKDEIWKPIKGYEGLYEISDMSRVKSLGRTQFESRRIYFKEERLLKKNISNVGYERVSLYKDGLSKSFSVHRLVAIAFIPNPMNKPCINHINAIRNDNRLFNLEWCTYSENNQHTHDLGRHTKGKAKIPR